MTKEKRLHPKVGAAMKEGPYCTFYSEFVNDDCYHNCMAHCRFREVMIDENVSKPRGYVRNGYKDGKWKDYPNYRYTAKLEITDEYDYKEKEND